MRKYIVYGHSGGLDRGAVMDESYKKACSSIMVNWLLPPTRKYGDRKPTTLLSVKLAYFSVIMRIPAISLAQSSTVALLQNCSSSLCLQHNNVTPNVVLNTAFFTPSRQTLQRLLLLNRERVFLFFFFFQMANTVNSILRTSVLVTTNVPFKVKT